MEGSGVTATERSDRCCHLDAAQDSSRSASSAPCRSVGARSSVTTPGVRASQPRRTPAVAPTARRATPPATGSAAAATSLQSPGRACGGAAPIRLPPPIAQGVRGRTVPTAARSWPGPSGRARSPTRSERRRPKRRPPGRGRRPLGGRPMHSGRASTKPRERSGTPRGSATGSRRSRNRRARRRPSRFIRGWWSPATTRAPTARFGRRPMPTSTGGRKGSASGARSRSGMRGLFSSGRHPTHPATRATRAQGGASRGASEVALATRRPRGGSRRRRARRGAGGSGGRARPEAPREASGRRQGPPGRRQGTQRRRPGRPRSPAEARVDLHADDMGERQCPAGSRAGALLRREPRREGGDRRGSPAGQGKAPPNGEALPATASWANGCGARPGCRLILPPRATRRLPHACG